MAISQFDRDRIEDLGIDPGEDRTEDLRRKAETRDTRILGGTGVTGPYPFKKEQQI